jgi:hyperosmotically inducible protein
MNLHLTIGPLVSLFAGILILVMPRLLNYIVAIYFDHYRSVGTVRQRRLSSAIVRAPRKQSSAITTAIKTKLAAEHITSLGRIHVDTDKDGVVWLTGSARTQEAADKATSIARGTEHVKAVHNDIKIKKDD